MGKLPGVNHLAAVKALEKAGFRIIRQGKHVVMSDGARFITYPATIPSMRLLWPELFGILG